MEKNKLAIYWYTRVNKSPRQTNSFPPYALFSVKNPSTHSLLQTCADGITHHAWGQLDSTFCYHGDPLEKCPSLFFPLSTGSLRGMCVWMYTCVCGWVGGREGNGDPWKMGVQAFRSAHWIGHNWWSSIYLSWRCSLDGRRHPKGRIIFSPPKGNDISRQ